MNTGSRYIQNATYIHHHASSNKLKCNMKQFVELPSYNRSNHSNQPKSNLFIVVNVHSGTSHICYAKHTIVDTFQNTIVYKFNALFQTTITFDNEEDFQIVRLQPVCRDHKQMQQFINQIALFSLPEYKYARLQTNSGARLILKMINTSGKRIIGRMMVRSSSTSSFKIGLKVSLSFNELRWIEALEDLSSEQHQLKLKEGEINDDSSECESSDESILC